MPERIERPKSSRYLRLGLAGIVVLGAAMFLTGIMWGLPSRRIDPYLFGGRPAWPGKQIAELARADQRSSTPRGADLDVNPLGPTTRPIALNDTDEKRAAIIVRYRLYTNQPDEMVTMMALASMKPGQRDFDPKLYQYGGLFVYPIGVLLKVCSVAGLITLKSDLTYYLDHPEAFGRFYVVARCYVAAFGLAGVAAVFWIARRIAAGLAPNHGGIPPESGTRNPTPALSGIFAALLYVLLPVVINMAHEAKPHLPGAVLMLFAVLAATRYVEHATWRWAVITGILCGASFGMVLSCLPIFVVIPLMTLLRRTSWPARAAHALAGCAIGGITYFATNPYVLINLFVNPEILRSNIGNTLAMFPWHGLREGLRNAAGLVAEGTSPLTAQIGLLGIVLLCVLAILARNGRTAESPRPTAIRSAPLWLLLAPAVIVFVQFTAAAAGKPGEYGRFAILPDITLAVATAVLVCRVRAGGAVVRSVFSLVLMLATAQQSYSYIRSFVIDARGGTRIAAAERIAGMRGRFGPLTIATFAEPAPYCMPPVDVFRDKLYLLPRATTPASLTLTPDVIVTVVDEARTTVMNEWSVDYKAEFAGTGTSVFAPARISWADKPFMLSVRRDLLAKEALADHAR